MHYSSQLFCAADMFESDSAVSQFNRPGIWQLQQALVNIQVWFRGQLRHKKPQITRIISENTQRIAISN